MVIKDFIKTDSNREIAFVRSFYDKNVNKYSGIVFLPGFRSDMEGTKAKALEKFCQKNNKDFLKFDYSGHGASSGEFESLCISDWLDDSLNVINALTTGPQILVGSSMGGWISLLLALKRKKRVSGLVLIAPAVDMTEILMWNNFSDNEKNMISKKGYLEIFSDEYPPYKITKNLIDDGRKYLLMNQQISLDCPVNIIHGIKDEAVPWDLSIELSKKISSNSITQSFIKDGDHGLSRPTDLEYIFFSIEQIIKKI